LRANTTRIETRLPVRASTAATVSLQSRCSGLIVGGYLGLRAARQVVAKDLVLER
jgi:hypothetical protein